MHASLSNSGALIDQGLPVAAAVVAGAGSDNIAYYTPKASRAGFGSCLASVDGKLTLAADETLTLVTVELQGSDDDGATWTAKTEVLGTNVLIATGALAAKGWKWNVPVNLEMWPAHVRLKVTPNLSAADTDTATVTARLIFGGPRDVPVTHTNPQVEG